MTKDKILSYLLLAISFIVVALFFIRLENLTFNKEYLQSQMASFNLTIYDSGLELKTATDKTTVQELLLDSNIKIHPQDSIYPPLKTPLSSGLRIVINRQVFKRKVSIPFKTLYVKDKNLLYGREVLREVGNRGLKEETYSLASEKSDQQILEEKILNSSKPKIIAQGTKIVFTDFGELGQASWCKPYSGWGDVAAHPIVKRGSRMLVTNLENSRQVVVKIVDWGPDRSVFPERVIDLSPEAFVKLGVPLKMGIIKEVKVEEIE